ncbi:hypothetical protein LX36DRAFT_332442 [Colletotrichum falcatum]|nr:hypothetical protein LX36DRAFT_332442 [Colletotrichum falcatum]
MNGGRLAFMLAPPPSLPLNRRGRRMTTEEDPRERPISRASPDWQAFGWEEGEGGRHETKPPRAGWAGAVLSLMFFLGNLFIHCIFGHFHIKGWSSLDSMFAPRDVALHTP